MRETSAEREEVIKPPLAPAMGYVAKPRDPVGGNEIVPYLFPVGALDRQTETGRQLFQSWVALCPHFQQNRLCKRKSDISVVISICLPIYQSIYLSIYLSIYTT